MERKTIEDILDSYVYECKNESKEKLFNRDVVLLAIKEYASHREQLAVRTALSTALDNAWLLYHCGTTKANTHGHKQINIGADNIKIDPVSILSLEQEIISKLKNEKG